MRTFAVWPRSATLMLVALVVLVVSGGCAGDGAQTPAALEGEETSVVVNGAMPEATVGASPDRTGRTRAPEEREFVSAPESEGGIGSGADSLLAVRHGEHDGFERVVLDLGVGDTPADDVPRWTLTTPEDDGLLRIHIPSVSTTYVSDGKLGDSMLRGFNVVRSPDGGLFIDIVSREAFSYRVFGTGDPARLTVDFASAEMRPLKLPPRRSGRTVVESPRTGEEVSSPITVSGYSRNFEGRNEISVLDRNGEVIAESSVQSNDWSDTWGFFETTLDLPDYTGRATLRVGQDSPKDGKFDGVEVRIRISG